MTSSFSFLIFKINKKHISVRINIYFASLVNIECWTLIFSPATKRIQGDVMASREFNKASHSPRLRRHQLHLYIKSSSCATFSLNTYSYIIILVYNWLYTKLLSVWQKNKLGIDSSFKIICINFFLLELAFGTYILFIYILPLLQV